MLPKVSIVTPSFNQGRYVARTVRSVLLQDYPNVEYLFLDGGSTDETLAAVAPYLDRFAYWRSARDAGQSAAVHEGLARARGEILGYLNSDDLLAPGTLSRVVEYFGRHPDVDAVYSHRLVIDEHGLVTHAWLLPPHADYLIRRWDWIPQETCFWRRRLFERAGNVDPGLAFAFDYELFVRYMRAGKFARLNGFLGAFRRHEDSKTVSQFETVGRREIELVHERHGIRLHPHDFLLGKGLGYLVTRLGALYVRLPSAGRRGRDYDSTFWGDRLAEDARKSE